MIWYLLVTAQHPFEVVSHCATSVAHSEAVCFAMFLFCADKKITKTVVSFDLIDVVYRFPGF
jgi:hypothetical protein